MRGRRENPGPVLEACRKVAEWDPGSSPGPGAQGAGSSGGSCEVAPRGGQLSGLGRERKAGDISGGRTPRAMGWGGREQSTRPPARPSVGCAQELACHVRSSAGTPGRGAGARWGGAPGPARHSSGSVSGSPPQKGEAGLVLAVPLCGGSRAPGEGAPTTTGLCGVGGRPSLCGVGGRPSLCGVGGRTSLRLSHSPLGQCRLSPGMDTAMTLGPGARGSRRDAEAHARGALVPRGGSGSAMPGAGCHAPVEACALPGAEPCSAANSVPAPRTGPRGRPGPPPVQDPATPAKPFRHMTCSLVRGPGSLQGPPFSLPR